MSEPKETKLDKKKKELYMELRELDEHLKKLNTHLEAAEEQLADLNNSKSILGKFKELKAGDDLRVPLTSGIYVKAELKDIKKVMINAGADVCVEKTPDQVIKVLDGQIEEISAYRENVLANMKELIKRIEEIQKQFDF
jgi:prefoldin alpha subunit